MEKHVYQEKKPIAGGDDDLLSNFDLSKFFKVLKNSIPWMILIIIATSTVAYLYIRYTKKVYQSVSEIKLDIKSEASLLGIQNASLDLDNITAEIELIRSKLFLAKVAEAAPIDVSYFREGNVLNEELFRNSPFEVVYEINNPAFYNRTFWLDVLDNDRITLRYQTGELEQRHDMKFGDAYNGNGFSFLISRRSADLIPPGNYSFIVNSEQAQVKSISQNLAVSPVNLNAKIIRVTMTDHNPYKAQYLVHLIDTLYLAYTDEQKVKETKLKIDFIEKQLEQTEAKLEEFENYFENFTINNKTTNLDREITEVIGRLEDVEKEIITLETALIQAESLLEAVRERESVHTLLPDLSEIPGDLSTEITNYNNLVKERALMLTSYNEQTFAVQKKTQELEIVRGRLVDILEKTVSSLKQEKVLYIRQRREINSNFRELPSLGTEYSRNKRNYQLFEGFYLSQLQTKAEFEIAQAGMVTDFAILTPATLPSEPVFPKDSAVFAGGVIAGIMLSFFLVAIRYIMDNKITTQSELERISLAPLLGVLPQYQMEKLPATKLVVNRFPKSAVSESLRAIRTNMEFLSAKKKRKVVSVTSTVGGEGKTFVAVNLGAIVAFSKHKVVIVDLDMRKPKIHSAFDDELGTAGVSTILINKHSIDESIKKTEVENLEYISAGPTPPNPSELLAADEFDTFLNTLKIRYDMVILDTPPAGLVTDAILVMKKADVPIYVVRSDYSRKDFIKNLNRLITINRFDNLSVIFNSVKASKGTHYGYGYSNNYGYDRGYFAETGDKKGIFARIRNLFS